MNHTIWKQIRFSLILVILSGVFLYGGFYLQDHPIQYPYPSTSEEETDTTPVSQYHPYQSSGTRKTEAEVLSETTEQASSEPAEAVIRFYTTKQASVFTFSGLGNEKELAGVLDALKKTKSRATFFVTDKEMEEIPEQISMIQEAGQSLGISVIPNGSASSREILSLLQSQSKALQDQYHVREEIFVRPAYGSASPRLLQAAGSGGYQVLSQMLEAVPEKVVRMTDADSILASIMKESDGKLQRGEIVHFQMGLLQRDPALLGQLVMKMVGEKGVYPILSAAEVFADKRNLYEYPVPKEKMLPGVADAIYPGHFLGMSDEEAFQVISNGYYGIYWVSTLDYLPGFSTSELYKLNQSGYVKNDANYVFLTFDDWGTDENVNHLLSVLKKHNAKGTFFVKTQYVKYNPNLLRAIAADGHTIASHTHMHMPLSNEVGKYSFAELSKEQVDTLQKDLVTSYETLQSVVGDMKDSNGKPSLSLLFRPPTLAVGKNGLRTVFDCGFKYSVSGSTSTEDYKATSVFDLTEKIWSQIRSGAVIVCHFSDNSTYTADAIDACLTRLEEKGSEYKFVGLDAVLN